MSRISQLVLLNDDGYLASSSFDCAIRLWNLEQRRCIRVLDAHDDFVADICVESGLLVSCGYDCKLLCWSVTELLADKGDSEDGAVAGFKHRLDKSIGMMELTDPTQVTTLGRLGAGHFGEVVEGRIRLGRPGEVPFPCAVKVPLVREGIDDLQCELEVLCDIQRVGGHPNIIAMVGFCQQPDIKLILEFADGGSLLVKLRNSRGPPRQLSGTDMLDFAVQVSGNQ